MASTTTLDVASAARDIRLAAGLSQDEAAARLNVVTAIVVLVERGREYPSWLFRRYRELWGIDPHVLAWCRGPVPACVAREAGAIAEGLGRIVESSS